MTDEKTSILKEQAVNYSKRYDQVSWRSADTDFEHPSSAEEHGRFTKSVVKKTGCTFCTKRNRKVSALVLVVIVFFLIMVALIYLYYSKPEALRETSGVNTDCGLVIGIAESFDVNGTSVESYVFKGIPYAVPPVNDLRWKAPIPLKKSKCWKDIYKATEFGSQCAQSTRDFSGSVGSEDCLFLNVWTPSLEKNAKLPVFVWIHGGSLMVFNGNIPGFSPDGEFVASMNVVAVSMNYRLNAFGFLTLKELWDDESYANYGFMDQVLVLKWIRDNIANFGGDPNSVTIIGQSSGGTCVFALLASPLADGLFHRAVSMSGSAKFEKSYKKASEENRIFINKSKCGNISDTDLRSCLYNLSTTEVLQAIPYIEYPYWYEASLFDFPEKSVLGGALAVIDPIVVPNLPSTLKDIKFRKPDKVSVLLGTMAQEIALMPVYTFTGKEQWKEYKAFLRTRLANFSSKFFSILFNNLYKNMTELNLSAELMHETVSTDVRETCPSNKLAKEFGLSTKHYVYRYVVTNHPLKKVSILGAEPTDHAAHGWDSTALFNYRAIPGYIADDNNKKFTNILRQNLKHFMQFGHMVDSGWSIGKTGVFNENANMVILVGDYQTKQCLFWNDLENGFQPYSWLN